MGHVFRCHACGRQPGSASSKAAKSNPGATVQPTSVHSPRLRADNKATLPTTIGEELSTNPFLRWHDPAIRKHLGMEKASDADVFAEIRKLKDNF